MKKLIILFIVGTIFLSGCADNSSTKSNKTPASAKTPINTVNNWYEGGSLHKAKISNWKASTDKNKLATCADFMATVDNSVSMDELKKRATNLKNCIDKAVEGLEITNNQSVSGIAASCITIMGY